MNSFVYSPAGDDKLFYEDGKVKVSYAEEGWREGLRFYKKLYDEQLLDNECFSMTFDQAKALGRSYGQPCGLPGRVSFHLRFRGSVINESRSSHRSRGRPACSRVRSNCSTRPRSMRSAPIARSGISFRWADAQLYDSTEDIRKGDFTWLNFWYGEEGVGWEKAGPNDVGFTGEKAAYKWLFNWGENQNTHWYETFLIN
jgi:hypothetical protein